MVDYKDKEDNIIRDSKIERDAVLEKYGKRINEVTELVDFYYDLIVMNPPYSTYINNEGKKVVNPSQLMVEEASNYLPIKGQIVILCRAQDLGMQSRSGIKIQKSIYIESIHYSSSNFNFTEVRAPIVGIIGGLISSESFINNRLQVFFDTTLLSKTSNQHYLPQFFRANAVSEKSVSLMLKIFDINNLEKWGTGSLYLWNADVSATMKKAGTNFDSVRFYSQQCGKNWSLPGLPEEGQSFNKFLISKLFIAIADIRAYDITRNASKSIGSFIKGCIPDNWRELDTDEKIYTHFNLTQEEIDFVENYQVQTYSK